MIRSRPFFLFLLFFALGTSFWPVWAAGDVGPRDEYYRVYDFKNDWLTYSPQYKNYVPYSQSLNEQELYHSLLIDLATFRHYQLLITSVRENYLFVEGALQKRIPPNAWLVLPIDSLRTVYKKENVLITLYGSTGIDTKTVLIGHAKKSKATAQDARRRPSSIISIKPLTTSPFEDFSIFVVLLLLLLSLFTYSSTPIGYLRFVQLTDFADRSERNDLYRFNKPYGRLMLLIATAMSMTMSYLFIFFAHMDLEPFKSIALLSEGVTLSDLLLDQVKGTLAFLGLYFLRYLFMELVGGVLNMGPAVNAHYIKALQLSYPFYGVCLLVIFCLLFQNPFWLSQLPLPLIYAVIVFYILRFVILYLFMTRKGQLINLYLFSYLCAIEIIPLIIGVKFAT